MGAEFESDAALLAKWEKLLRGKRAWEAWARSGALLWLAQRPRLRGWPLPWPGCQGVADYVLQPHSQRPGVTVASVPSAMLLELMLLRRQLGSAAFVQSDKVTAAQRIAVPRPGAMARVRRDAAREALAVAEGAVTPRAPARAAGSPRPRAKEPDGLVGTGAVASQVPREPRGPSQSSSPCVALGPSAASPTAWTTADALRPGTGGATSRYAPRDCQCKLPAVLLTVKKEGHNNGRHFWRCPRDRLRQCSYFEWIDPDPYVASLSAAGPETLPALPACEQMLQLQRVAAEAAQRALQALIHGPQPPLAATCPRDRQVENFWLMEESDGEDTER